MMNKHKFKSGDTSFILDNLNTAVFRTGVENPGKIIDINPAFLSTFGYTDREEMNSISALDLYADPEDRGKIRDELNTNGSLRDREIAFKKKDGSIFYGRVSSVLVKDDEGKVLYIDGIVDDMTKQKLQLEALNDTRARLRERQEELLEERKVFLSGPVIQIRWPLSENDALSYISENVKDILGYESEEFTRGDILYPDLVHDDDRVELQDHIRSFLEKGVDVICLQPYRLRHKNGKYIWVQDYGYVQKDQDGQPTSILGYIYDVTELEEAHQRIVESESRYRGLVENSPTGILRIDLAGNILDVNPRMVEILGSPSAEKTKSFNIFTFKPLRDAGVSQEFETVIREKRLVRFTTEYTTNWGKVVYAQVVINPVHDAQGSIIGAQANMEDITTQHLAEREIREIEQAQLEERKLFLAGPIMIFKWEVDSSIPISQVSENIESILGYSTQELLDREITYSDILHPEDADRVITTSYQALESGRDTFDTLAYRICRKDGSYIWVNDHSTVIRGENGSVKYVSGIVYDITQLITAEEELKLTEQTYQELFNAISEAVFIHDPDTYEILDVNETMLRMYGYERQEVVGTDIQKFSASSSDVMPLVAEVFKLVIAEGQRTVEWEARHKDGHKFWVEVSLRPAIIHGQRRMLANVRDISSRKDILVKLEQSLKEQDLLLREVHHRVKNNMQVIISLLNLQAEHTQSNELFEIFGETQNRIRTMALIHEKLFRSSSMSSVDFRDYLKTLVYDLNNFYSIDSRRIKIHQEVANIDLDITKAIPCGLIVNELITNALKYAFPNKRQGGIWLCVKALEGDMAEVGVRDDGIGLDASLDFETTQTMGLRIVRILTEQLGGQMTVRKTKGASFSIRFSLLEDE